MTKEQLRMQMLAGIITEGQYKAELNESKRDRIAIENLKRWIDENFEELNNLGDSEVIEYPLNLFGNEIGEFGDEVTDFLEENGEFRYNGIVVYFVDRTYRINIEKI